MTEEEFRNFEIAALKEKQRQRDLRKMQGLDPLGPDEEPGHNAQRRAVNRTVRNLARSPATAPRTLKQKILDKVKDEVKETMRAFSPRKRAAIKKAVVTHGRRIADNYDNYEEKSSGTRYGGANFQTWLTAPLPKAPKPKKAGHASTLPAPSYTFGNLGKIANHGTPVPVSHSLWTGKKKKGGKK